MANSQFEYVKQFELPDALLPSTWLVVRVDGSNFHSLSSQQQWAKPNDERQLQLMNAAAQRVMAEYSDISLAIGMSDEFSFVLPPSSSLYNRRRDKLVSCLTSLFTSAYTFLYYPAFFPTPLPYPPHFDGRVIAYPTEQHLRDYLAWRQADCHINNLYNTTYWALRQRLGLTAAQAHARLSGSDSAAKHELLFRSFAINYNDEPAAHRKGSIIVWERYQQKPEEEEEGRRQPPHAGGPAADGMPDGEDTVSEVVVGEGGGGDAVRSKRSSPRMRRRTVVLHEDLITAPFFTTHPGIIPPLTNTDWKKRAAAKDDTKAKKAHHRRQSTPLTPTLTPLISISTARVDEDETKEPLPLPPQPSPVRGEEGVERKPLTFLSRRPLSISSMSPSNSPNPPSPLPPIPSSPSPTTPTPLSHPHPATTRHSAGGKPGLTASILYDDIVHRVYSENDAHLPHPADRTIASPTHASHDSHTPHTTTHRRLHKSGFAQLESTVEEAEGMTSPAARASSFPYASTEKSLPTVTFDLSLDPSPPSSSPTSSSSPSSIPTPDIHTAPTHSPTPSSTPPPSDGLRPGDVQLDHHRTASSGPFFQTDESANVVTSPSSTNSSTRSPHPRPPPLTTSQPKEARNTIARTTSAASSAQSVFDNVTADASPSPSPSPPPALLSPMPTHRLFSHFLVLGSLPSPNLLPSRPASWTEEPRILLEFPHSSHLHSPSLPSFAFPTGVRIDRIDQSSLFGGSMLYGQRQFQRTEHVHVFLIKMSGEAESQLFVDQVMHGVCVLAREVTNIRDVHGQMHELSCDTAYCLLSHFPFFSLHADVLFSLLMLLHLHRAQKLAALPAHDITHPRSKPLGPHQVPACVSLLKRYYAMRVPAAGDGFVLEVDSSLPSIQFERVGGGVGGVGDVVSEAEVGLYVSQWSMCVAWTFVSAEMVVDMLECALRETKIIVVDPNLAMLSAAVLSFIPLVRPLSWTSIILPILPSDLHDFLDAPVPIIAGVPDLPDRLCQQRQLDSNTAVWFPSGNKLWLPQGWKSMLPNRGKLRDAVKKGLLQLRKGKTQLVPGKASASALTYKCPPGEWAGYDAVLKELNEWTGLLCDYTANTEMGRLPRDKDKEPFVSVLKQTQMMQLWLERHRDTAL